MSGKCLLNIITVIRQVLSVKFVDLLSILSMTNWSQWAKPEPNPALQKIWQKEQKLFEESLKKDKPQQEERILGRDIETTKRSRISKRGWIDTNKVHSPKEGYEKTKKAFCKICKKAFNSKVRCGGFIKKTTCSPECYRSFRFLYHKSTS